MIHHLLSLWLWGEPSIHFQLRYLEYAVVKVQYGLKARYINFLVLPLKIINHVFSIIIVKILVKSIVIKTGNIWF